MALWAKSGYHEAPLKFSGRENQDVETFEEVKRIVAKSLQIPIEQLTNDATLEGLGAESMRVIEIVYDIEERFDIAVPIRPGESSLVIEMETDGARSSVKLETIGDIARAVQSLVDARSCR